MKKSKTMVLACMLAFSSCTNAFAITDNAIFRDVVQDTYSGNDEAKATIPNLKFYDVPNGYWAKEAITKAGALNLIKGYDRSFRPSASVSNEEALAFAIRVMGLEKEAQAEGERLKAQSNTQGVLDVWSLGYLSLARTNGLITQAQYTDATNPNQEQLPAGSFLRNAPASREQVATWIIKALDIKTGAPLTSNTQQSLYNYSDWENISSENAEYMETALDNGIIKGSNGRLNPKGAITRAEMAQVLSNMGDIYNNSVGLNRKLGTVAGIKDEQLSTTGEATLQRKIYIRTSDGKVEVISYIMQKDNTPNPLNKDAVVYNAGAVTGLSSLREGSEVEYLVDDLTKEIKFVSVKDKTVDTTSVSGKLNSIDYQNGIIQLKDKNDKTFNYYTVDAILGNNAKGNYIEIDGKVRKDKDLPFGSMLKLELKNNIVTKISYVGDANLSKELRGVVVENNPQYGYMIILDNNGNRITKNYYKDEVEVEKQTYDLKSDDVGYLDQMFPNFEYDPRDTTIDKIEAGDIVFIESKKDEPTYIERISASTNYIMRRAKVLQVDDEVDLVKILVEFENKQTSWYEVSSDVFASKSGKPIKLTQVTAGDYVKLLMNEAVLAPGEVFESVKEIIVEDSGHIIGDILKGQVGTFDAIQKKLSLQNSYTFGKGGWQDYKQIRQLSTSNKNIQYYYDGNRVSPDFIKTKLKRSNGEVYVALEKGYSGDVISKVTFRSGRDEELAPDIVVTTNGINSFTTPSNGTITTDEGTIIRKDGKLVSAANINVNDYVRVCLNGDGRASVVDIMEAPVTKSVTIARARIKSINENKSFTVKSMSMLNGDKWEYSPVERTFTIDGQTTYISKDGIKNINQFIGYTTDSKIDQTFTIVFEGDRASHIIEAPYPTKIVSGVVYEAGDIVKMKDAKYMKDDNTWDSVSVKDPTITMNLKTELNTIVIKNNKVTNVSSIQKGDRLKVFTESIPSKISSGMEINARIVFVEN